MTAASTSWGLVCLLCSCTRATGGCDQCAIRFDCFLRTRTSRGLLQSRFLARQLSCCAWRVDELVRDYRYCNGNATAVAASVALDCWNNAAGVAEQHHHRLGQVRLLKMVIRRRIISTFSGRWASSSFGIGRTFFILESPNHHHLDQWEGHLHRPGSHPLSGKRQDLLYL